MQKLIITVLAGLFSTNIMAACPSAISGTYSGYATWTELDKTGQSVSDTAGKLFVISLDGKGTASVKGSLTTIKYVEVDAATANGSKKLTSLPSIKYNFDKATCTGTIYDPQGGNIDLVVSNAGNTIYGVKQDLNDNGTYANTVEQYVLTKQ